MFLPGGGFLHAAAFDLGAECILTRLYLEAFPWLERERPIHGICRLYEVVGLGWVYGFTRYEPLRRAADAVYAVRSRR